PVTVGKGDDAFAVGGQGPFSGAFLDACDGQLLTQFEVAQILADRHGITREDMDAYAVESHVRAHEATVDGRSASEIVPVPRRDRDGMLTDELVTVDEGIRPD
ncbi:MAG: hypothetical protein KDB33_16835, partial [Acidimicrobiales bacterium]|nr:hypothetical protein [Acidimicrobiales bacterium]